MNTSSPRILLVDDMPSIHEDFRKVLCPTAPARALDDAEAALFGDAPQREAKVFELDSAYQGREGVAMAQAAVSSGRPYALAFVDMRMPPGWDGVETIDQLWRADPGLQVVICTAYSDHPWDDVLARLDVRDRLLILKKPFDVIEVAQMAHTLTAKWLATREAERQRAKLEAAISELKAVEAALRLSNRELEAFSSSVSHDLRAPLSVISGFSHIMGRHLEAGDAAKGLRSLARIQAAAHHMNQLMEGLLALAQVARVQLRHTPVDLSAMATEILEQLRAAEPGRVASFHVTPGMRPSADARLLRVAMENLLSNAWKFSSRQAHAEISVGCDMGAGGEEGPVFHVRDNGAGFDMKFAGKLFHTFERLHAAQDFPGTGVGLATVQRVVQRHGGHIRAESEPGKGTTFFFTLPQGHAVEPAIDGMLRRKGDSRFGELA